MFGSVGCSPAVPSERLLNYKTFGGGVDVCLTMDLLRTNADVGEVSLSGFKSVDDLHFRLRVTW